MDKKSVVFMVDDDYAVREGIELLVKSVGMEFKGFSSAQEYQDGCEPSERGCLVLDVRMPGMGGLALQEELAKRDYSLPVIVLTGHGNVKMGVQAMKAGAFDFIEKPPAEQMLLDTVQKAIRKDSEVRISQEEQQARCDKLAQLTPRGREILAKILDGKVNKQIAGELDLSEKTIEFHRAKLMKQLEVDCLHGLIRFALSTGLYE
jgi:two-component system response regulator FixJ